MHLDPIGIPYTPVYKVIVSARMMNTLIGKFSRQLGMSFSVQSDTSDPSRPPYYNNTQIFGIPVEVSRYIEPSVMMMTAQSGDRYARMVFSERIVEEVDSHVLGRMLLDAQDTLRRKLEEYQYKKIVQDAYRVPPPVPKHVDRLKKVRSLIIEQEDERDEK
jgi:hypothetical protein